jgi:hypothetical protein
MLLQFETHYNQRIQLAIPQAGKQACPDIATCE